MEGRCEIALMKCGQRIVKEGWGTKYRATARGTVQAPNGALEHPQLQFWWTRTANHRHRRQELLLPTIEANILPGEILGCTATNHKNLMKVETEQKM